MTHQDTNNRVSAMIHTDEQEAKAYKKLTEKQWTVYFYLLSVSNYNAAAQENHRYVYKKDINITQVSKKMGISRPTFYKAIDTLIEYNLITPTNEHYLLEIQPSYTMINKTLLVQLLYYRKILGIDLLRTYLFCKLLFKLSKNKLFTKKNVIVCLGHNETDGDIYKMIEIYLNLLNYWKLIKISSEVKNTNCGQIRLYRLIDIKDSSDYLNELMKEDDNTTDDGLPLEEIEKIKKML